MEVIKVGFFRRVVASFLDTAIILFVGIGLSSVIYPVSIGPDDLLGSLASMFSLLFGSLQIISICAFIVLFMEILFDASPAKLLLGLRIGKSNGEEADIEMLASRALLKGSPFLLTGLAYSISIEALQSVGGVVGLALTLGCLLALGQRRQTFHDRLTDTAVFRRGSIAVLTPAVSADSL